MTSTSTLRQWWAGYRCDTNDFTKVAFPTPNGAISLSVAKPSVPVWEAFADIMAAEKYLFREGAGGTYKCRHMSSGSWSLHAYAIALDLNPKANPQKTPLTYDYPESFIRKVESMTANGKRAITWGGRWTSVPPDAMHWQLDVHPNDCKDIKYEGSDDMDGPNGEPNWDEVSDWAKTSWTKAYQAGMLTDSSHPRDSLEVEQLMVYLDRAGVI